MGVASIAPSKLTDSFENFSIEKSYGLTHRQAGYLNTPYWHTEEEGWFVSIPIVRSSDECLVII